MMLPFHQGFFFAAIFVSAVLLSDVKSVLSAYCCTMLPLLCVEFPFSASNIIIFGGGRRLAAENVGRKLKCPFPRKCWRG